MSTRTLQNHAFTLVEIMIVVAIIALLAAIAVPGFLRARKRSQASRIINDLRMIDSAVDQYAIETNKTTGASVNVSDWTNYLKKNSMLYNTGNDLFGNAYGPQAVDSVVFFNRALLCSDVDGFLCRPNDHFWPEAIYSRGRPAPDFHGNIPALRDSAMSAGNCERKCQWE